MRNIITILSILLLSGIALNSLAEEKTTESSKGFGFVDKDGDGINDNLIAETNEIAGSTGEAESKKQGPGSDKGGRQEARSRYRHGYHGKELERSQQQHQHGQ